MSVLTLTGALIDGQNLGDFSLWISSRSKLGQTLQGKDDRPSLPFLSAGGDSLHLIGLRRFSDLAYKGIGSKTIIHCVCVPPTPPPPPAKTEYNLYFGGKQPYSVI